MNEHPDIAELSASELSSAVSEHLKECDVCSQIYDDIQLLNMDLKELSTHVEIPESINDKVYDEISVRSKLIRKALFKKNLIASVSAIAAVLILSITVVTNLKSNKGIVADINGDGEVNVLDSLTFAQKLESKNFEKENDLNGDGLINTDDLLIVRQAVVNIDRGSLP